MIEQRRLLVVATARSGTGFTASLLRRSGLDIGHEAVFSPSQPDPLPPLPRCDVSWLAVPRLPGLDPEWAVVHQVRHPCKVASSLLSIGLLESRTAVGHKIRFWLATRTGRTPSRSGPSYVSVAYRNTPEIHWARNDVDRAFRYWLEWNRLIETTLGDSGLRRLRVEDIDEQAVRELVALVNTSPSTELDRIDDALDRTPKSTNHRGSGPELSFADISHNKLRREVESMAARYGYSE